MSRNSIFAGLLCGVVLLGLSASATTNRRVARKHGERPKAAAEKPQAQAPDAPAIAEPPPTPEQLPPTTPKVVMNGGLLSISAENSTLGDVLGAVRNLTGATVDVPTSIGAQRVAVNLGPGEPQQVLQQLFAGANFDYIILGSPTNTGAIEKIIVSKAQPGQSGSGPVNNAANQAPQTYQPPPQMYRPPGSYQHPPMPPDEQADTGNIDDDVVQPEPPPPQQEVTPPQQDENGQQNQQGPKTPEQLLRELQRLQQQGLQRPQR